jgi:hypothetical protein
MDARKKISQSLRTFISRVTKVFCPETISNEYLWQMAKDKPIIQQIKERE